MIILVQDKTVHFPIVYPEYCDNTHETISCCNVFVVFC